MSFYEVIGDITADTGIRVRGTTPEDIFCKSILATFNEMTDIEGVEATQEHTLEVEGELPYLLADTINRALVLFESKGFVAKECKVLELTQRGVKVYLRGATFDPERNESKLVIKAATYHRLRLERTGDGYVAEVIFDI